MDEKLLRRIEAIGVLLIAVAYFLPWASIMSPLGSIELRGLYVDYAWIILLLAILHLVLEFALANKASLGLSAYSMNYVELIWRILPFVFVAFFTWYGTNFVFSVHSASSEGHVSIFGTSVDSIMRASLDYGYWIGVCGTVLSIAGVGLLSKQGLKFFSGAAVIVIATVGLAFGFSRPGKQIKQAGINSTLADSANPPTTNVGAPAPVPSSAADTGFDSSSYVQVISISAKQLAKDYDLSRYSNSILISPVFKNIGPNTIVGLQGHLTVIDGFGKEVYGFNFRNDDKIPPGHDSGRGGYSFDENQFESDDTYH